MSFPSILMHCPWGEKALTGYPFLESQLKPAPLEDACRRSGVALELRLQAGYDHSYFFIATFIEDQLRFHARHL